MYSSFNRLIRVTAWVKRFISNSRNTEKRKDELSIIEIVESKEFWFKKIQHEEFKDVISDILKQRRNQQQIQFGLYIDEGGLIRCRNRMYNLLPTEESSKILLPKDNYLTWLLIKISM